MALCRYIVILLLIATKANALTEYYIDPDYSGGGRNGSAVMPWQSLDDINAWADINAALASDDVTVYFSARAAGADVPQETTTQISLMRTDASTHRLTLDGKSRYNTNDVLPSWATYDDGADPAHTRDGGDAFKVAAAGSTIYSSGILTDKQNYVTIAGFITESTGSGKCVSYWAGDHIIITDIHCSQTDTASGGPNFYFQCILNNGDTACPSDRDGGASCFPSTDIEWSYLKVDGGYGEGLYHCGCYTQTDSACMTGHSNVWVHHNIFKDASLRSSPTSGQGDGIEIKPSVSDVTIEDNTIYWEDQDPSGLDYVMAYGIIINASGIVQRNFIYNYPGDGILLNENADEALGFRSASQTKIVNNVLVDVGRRSVGTWKHGIHANYEIGEDDWANVLLANNTIYHAGSNGIYVEHTNAAQFDVQNNIVSECGDVELRFNGDAASAHDYNLLYDTSGTVYNYNSATVAYNGPISLFEWHSIVDDSPDFISTAAPYLASNFALKALAPGIGMGADLSTFFTDDFNGDTRSDWDMGAHAYSDSSGSPGPPADSAGSGCFIHTATFGF